MTDEQKAKLLAAGDEYFVLDSTDKGAAICKVIEKKAPKTVYNIGEVSFVVDPSKDTRANLLNDLQKFLDKNNTAQAFFDNAAKAEHSYTAMRDVVLSSQAMLGNSVKNSSKLIHWLFKDAKEGEVSAIQQDNDVLIVVALAQVYDDGFRPLSDPETKAYCEMKARNLKKADALAKKYAGKANDINGYARLMNSAVQTLTVGTYPNMEAALDGQVPFAKVGKVYGPVKGTNSLFVYTVVKKNAAVNKIDDAQLANMCKQQLGQALTSDFWALLKGGKEVTVYFGTEVEDALLDYLEERDRIIPEQGHEDALFLSLQRRRMAVRSVENLVKKYARTVAPLKPITPHKLRSTYGTNLYRETGDIYLVADVLGHSDVNTTKRHYAALEDERRRSARNKVRLREK